MFEGRWSSGSTSEIATDKLQVGELVGRRKRRFVRHQSTLPAPVEEGDPGNVVAGRYRLGHLLGEGGMGRVFEVRHTRLEKAFALKLLHPHLTSDPDLRRAFFREAKYASGLQHPNLISVVDFGEDRDYGPYMVMELAKGKLLSDYLEAREFLSVRRATDIVLQLAEVLDFVHSQGIVHGDIKPQNVLLCREAGENRRRYKVKLIDFGLAMDQRGPRTGRIFGTPEYLAPELGKKGAVEHTADVYSLGVLLFELLAGTVPFDGTAFEVVEAHRRKPAPTLSEASGRAFDSSIERFVAKLLSKNPTERPGSMAALIYELRAIMDMLGMQRPLSARRSTAVRTTQTVVDKRTAIIKATYESLHLPLATLNANGEIVAANPAFCRFVIGMRVQIEGTQIRQTLLARAWPTLEHDLAAALDGEEIGKLVTIGTPETEEVSMQMWLEPTIMPGYVALTLYPEG
jgi:serine/threonine protein kinase